MGRVTESLDRYLRALVARGSPVEDHLVPGDEPVEIRRRLVDVGLDPCDDVVEWFAWFGGTTHRPRRTYLFQQRRPVGLRDALEERRRILDQAEEDALPEDGLTAEMIFRSSWLPLLPDQPVTAVELPSAVVWDIWFDEPPRRRFDSLADFVESERLRLESGEVRVASDGRLALPHQLDVLPEWEGANWTLFKPGVTDLGWSHEVGLPTVLAVFEGREATGLKVRGVSTGQVSGNRGLEEHQLRLIVDSLVALGIPPESIIVEQIATDETSVHRIDFFTRRADD